MKKSNKLLVTLLSLFALVTMASNLILKAEYDKVDVKDGIQKAEKQISLDFIDDYPIKIDGGSFYTYDTTLLSHEKHIFIISKDKVGFIEQAGDFIIFNRIKRQVRMNGYSDLYKSKDYDLSLAVNKTKDIGQGRSEYKGTMIIKSGKTVRTVKVHGLVDEAIK